MNARSDRPRLLSSTCPEDTLNPPPRSKFTPSARRQPMGSLALSPRVLGSEPLYSDAAELSPESPDHLASATDAPVLSRCHHLSLSSGAGA